MKPVFTGLALLLFLPSIYCQTDSPFEIPRPVMDQFTLSYPDAENVEWTVQHGKYLANFKNYKKHTSAMLREDGKLLQTETEIKVIALPVEATSYLQEDIKAKKIETASIVENETGEITFKAFTDKDQYWFDGDGQVLYQDDLAVVPKLK